MQVNSIVQFKMTRYDITNISYIIWIYILNIVSIFIKLIKVIYIYIYICYFWAMWVFHNLRWRYIAVITCNTFYKYTILKFIKLISIVVEEIDL